MDKNQREPTKTNNKKQTQSLNSNRGIVVHFCIVITLKCLYLTIATHLSQNYAKCIKRDFLKAVDFTSNELYNLDNKSRKIGKEKEPHQTAIRCDSIHQLLTVDDDIF